MRLRRLHVERLPGIHPGFVLEDVAPGVNVVVGPNASGKSSVLRAVEALLYPERRPGKAVLLEAVFEDAGGELLARRIGDTVTWTREGRDAPAPALPDAHLFGCYALGIEDLGTLDATDREISQRLSRALRGGYDLEAVRTGLGVQGSGHKEAKALRDADAALNRLSGQREQLAAEQANLTRWSELEHEGRTARREAADHERALEILAASRAARAAGRALAAFPPQMELLAGNEIERLERLRDEMAAHEAELEAAGGEAEAARRALQRSGLEASELSAAAVEDQARSLNQLRSLEAELAGLEERRLDAVARRGRALEGLGAEPDDTSGPRLEPATLSEVDGALETRRRLRAELRELEHELDRLPTEEDLAEPAGRIEDARAELRAWLAAGRNRTWTAGRAFGLALTVAGGAGGLALAIVAGARTLPAAVPAAALALGLLLVLRAGRTASERPAARERFASTGLEAPASWDEAGVRTRLTELEGAAARAEALRVKLEQRAEVNRRLDRLRGRQLEADEELTALADRVGFDPTALDAGLERWLRLVDAFDAADTALRELDARLDALRERAGTMRAAVVAFLTAHGEAPEGASPSANVLDGRRTALSARLAERDRARRDLQQAEAVRARAQKDLDRLRRDAAALLQEAGLEVDGPGGQGAAERELRARLERLPDYRDQRRAHREAEVLEGVRRDALAHRPDLTAAADDDREDALRQRLAELQEDIERGEEASRQKAATQALIREAEHERTLERARASRQAAAEALQDKLDEALQAEAAAFLLDEVEREHQQTREPASLRRARDWFRRFTRNHYELRFEGGRQASFSALETTSGEHRALDELSTGTRAQLLLAVRVAFVTEAERGATALPLFLDEALTTADAERFRAVSGSLGLLAREEGRQLFYLTARSEDGRLWSGLPDGGRPAAASRQERAAEPHVVDIARLRGRAGAITDPRQLALPDRAPVPAPDGRTPEAYALALGVPAIDPWQPAGACHLFHLLRDDLALLGRLLRAGVTHLGPLRSLLREAAAEALLSDEERRRLVLRAQALEAFLEAWRAGRGRPVDRHALDASGAVTEAFLDRVDALARSVGGDAAALLEGLASRQVPRFRSKDRRRLEAWLRDHGYLDDGPRSTAEDLRRRVLTALAAHTGAAARDRDDLLEAATALCDAFTSGVRAGKGGDAPSRPAPS